MEPKTINIDPAKFADQIPRDTTTGENIFNETDVLKFLIDQMNVAGEDISMIHQDHEIAIEYKGRREYFSMGISSLDTPEGAAREGMEELSNILNNDAKTESWVEYQHGLYYLHIEESVEDVSS